MKHVPDILITVLVASLISHFTGVKYGLKTLGPKTAGFLKPGFGDGITFSKIMDMFPSTFSIAIIGMVESILVAQIYSSKLNYRVSNNRELVAVGLCNLLGSVFKIFPSFASLGRSAVNFQSGGRSQIASLISASIVGVSILVLLPYFQNLPKVALACVIVNAALGIFEFDELVFLWKVHAWQDLALFMFSFLITNALGIEIGITMTILASLLLIVKHTSSPHVGESSIFGLCSVIDCIIAILHRSQADQNQFEEIAVIRDVNLFEEKHDYNYEYKTDSGVLIMRVDEPLYFANIGQIKELLLKLEVTGNVKIRAIIFDAANIPFIDASAAHTLLELIEEWHERHITTCMVKTRPKVVRMLAKSGIIRAISTKQMFSSLSEAVEWLELKRDSHNSMINYVDLP